MPISFARQKDGTLWWSTRMPGTFIRQRSQETAPVSAVVYLLLETQTCTLNVNEPFLVFGENDQLG
jgi:hypothetical protein